LSVKRGLREPIRIKRPELWYNAPAPISLVLRSSFAYDFVGVIPKLKRPLQRTRFKSIGEIKKIGKGADGYTERIIWHVSKLGKNVGVSVFYREGITRKG